MAVGLSYLVTVDPGQECTAEDAGTMFFTATHPLLDAPCKVFSWKFMVKAGGICKAWVTKCPGKNIGKCCFSLEFSMAIVAELSAH